MTKSDESKSLNILSYALSSMDQRKGKPHKWHNSGGHNKRTKPISVFKYLI